MNNHNEEQVLELIQPMHSVESENALLGGLLIDPKRLDDIVDILCTDDFYALRNKTIFSHMLKLSDLNNHIDPTTITESIISAGDDSSKNLFMSIAVLAQSVTPNAYLPHYAKAIKNKSIERKIFSASMLISETATNTDLTTEEKVMEAQRLILDIESHDADEPPELMDTLRKMVEEIDRRYNSDEQYFGITTGFSLLDQRTTGFNGSDLIIVAGRPSMGKTTLALNIVEHVILNLKQPALFFSMEMSAQNLTQKLTSSISSIPYSFIRSGKLFEQHWPLLTTAISKLKGAKLVIDDRPALSINQMRSTARKLNKKHKLGIIVVDYLQLATANLPKGHSREREVSMISAGLKSIAKELDVPVIALSQLNRDCEKGPNKRPANHHLRDSGSIEQDADVIMFIYRDEVYYPDSQHKGITEIISTKVRNGEIGTDYIKTKLNISKFDNLNEEVPTLEERSDGYNYYSAGE